jgi:hypothetical protein
MGHFWCLIESMGTRWKTRIILFLGLLLCAFPLLATKDRPCRSGEFQLTAQPAKRTFAKGEPVKIQLSFTNLTSRDVHIVPYLFPFDYWVDKHSDRRWKSLATGIVGPNAKERHSSLLAPTQRSEYRQVHSGETFTTHFDVELSSISKSVLGTYRLNAVRAHVYESDSVEQNSGCAVFAATSPPFTVQ